MIGALAFLGLLSLASADIQYREPSSGLTFNMSATKTSSVDLHMNMSVPAQYGWGAVGIGSEMNGALMFILLPDSQNGSTISVRSAAGHDMPVPFSGIDFQMTEASSDGNTLTAQGTCISCSSWGGSGSLSLTSTSQSFIWAVGPGTSGVQGSGASANIAEHSSYGNFAVNMVQAQNQETTAQATDVSDPSDNLVTAHAIILGGAFGIAMPLAVVLLRTPELGFTPHWVLQSIAGLASAIGLAIAIYLSVNSDEYSMFNTTHQILGIVVVAVVLPQAFLGRAHHVNYKKVGGRSLVSYLHIWGGRSLILLGMVNIILGFVLAGENSKAIAAAVIIAIIYILVTLYVWWRSRSQTQKAIQVNTNTEWYPLASHGATSQESGLNNYPMSPTRNRMNRDQIPVLPRYPSHGTGYQPRPGGNMM